MIRETLKTTPLVFAALLAGAAAAQPVQQGDALGASVEAISAALAARGYDVRKVERENGKFEAKALRDGARWEIYVDRSTGAVQRVKRDD